MLHDGTKRNQGTGSHPATWMQRWVQLSRDWCHLDLVPKGQQQLDSLALRCGDGDAERARGMPPTQCEGQVLPLTG